MAEPKKDDILEDILSGEQAQDAEDTGEPVDEAEAELTALLERHPRSTGALHNLGYLLAETGRAAEAETRYREAVRARVEAMSAWERREYLAFVCDGFFLIGRLQRFAEDRDFLGRLAQEELNKIPIELIQAYKQFGEYLNPKTALLDFELPRFRELDTEFRESQRAGRDWDRRLKAHIKATAPDTLIWLEHRNYWKSNSIGSTERTYECFISEAELSEFLDCWHQAEWDGYCNGHGDPSLSYLEIRIKRPGGEWEDYRA